MNKPTQEQIADLKQAISVQESLRSTVGDTVVDVAIAALCEKLAELEAQARPTDQQRKQITVLFADVTGFTAMSEAMDAEDVTEVMNTLWERLDRVIVAHGGLIDKHIGDAVMALWGAEQARENDPERAIRAALEIQKEIQEFNTQTGLAPPIQMRIGVNTGSVLLGEMGTIGEYTAIGDAVNIAEKLERAAPEKGILISHATQRHVLGVFSLRPYKPIQVEARTEPLRAYLVLTAKPRAFRKGTRGVEGVETRMIGRKEELNRLQDIFSTLVEGGERHMVTITGEAGIGKSRLLHEFDIWTELSPYHFYFFKGRASQEMQHRPYDLIRDLFSFRFQIQDSDPAQVVRTKIERGVEDALGESEYSRMKARFIGQLLGFDLGHSLHLQAVLDDAQHLRDRALTYLNEYFRAMTARYPVLILLEDLHWANESSLDVLNHLMLTMSEQPLLVICTARPSLFSRRPHWGEGQSFHTRLDLLPLSKWHARSLVKEILRKVDQVPAALRELVVGQAGGNPFYVEELIKMLLEDKVIVKGDDCWYVEPFHLTQVRVPSTLIGVLQARLDKLLPNERRILQCASVIGRVFWDAILEPLGREVVTDTGQTFKVLNSLCERELIFRRESSALVGAQEYIFKHVILHQVAYESLLKRDRRVLHKRVAEWLIDYSGERIGEYTGLIADHLESAGQTQKAIAYLGRAGEKAARQFANAEAVDYLSRALKLAPEVDYAERYALLLAREQVYHVQGRRNAQHQDLTDLEALAETMDDDHHRAEVALRRGHYAWQVSDFSAAVSASQVAVNLAGICQAVGLEAAGYLQWGRALFSQGDYETSRLQLERALTLAQRIQSHELEADILRNLGNVSLTQGDFEVAKDSYQQALDLCRAAGDRQREGYIFINLGALCYHLDDFGQAKAYYKQGLEICRETNARRGESAVLGNLGLIAGEQGDYVSARTYYKEALRIHREIGNRWGEGIALGNLGRAHQHLGDYARARTYYERALRIYDEIGNRQGEGREQSVMALLYHQMGDNETAREYGQRALQIAQELGDRHVQGFALVHLGHALTALGRLDEAEDAYRQAMALRRELGQSNMVIEALVGLVGVLLARGDLSQAQLAVEQILSHLASNNLDGTEEPFRVYQTCYRVLHANDDPRASQILATAHALLQERAVRIPDDATRLSFLENVAAHREIVAEWQRMANNPSPG